uniref:Cyclin dependent kinase 2 associated protein 2 n=1 Tax=Podarcis muralis TaxID=64176 RepID=A0A670JZS2_PODMU
MKEELGGGGKGGKSSLSEEPVEPRTLLTKFPISSHIVSATSVPSPSGAISGASAPFRPLFNDFGPPSMGYVQAMKPPGAQGSQSTYTDLLSVIEEMGKEIRPTYAGSKSAMERLKRGIIHARALVRECLAETERNART